MSLSNTGFRTDIKETEEEYIIEAELPGLDKEDITLEVDGDSLVISANNEETIEEEREGYLRKERKVGRFQRSFRLDNVNEDGIEADYENGLLTVTLPKEEPGSTETRTIDIN
nr:Hsp20/alpha crystallin family protein [Sporohalobacter salinus]